MRAAERHDATDHTRCLYRGALAPRRMYRWWPERDRPSRRRSRRWRAWPPRPGWRPRCAVPRVARAPREGARHPRVCRYPEGCTLAEVEIFLDRLLAAFNRGDVAALGAFSPGKAAARGVPDFTGEQFVWYSVIDHWPDGTARHFVACDLPTLWADFAERHARHETLHLVAVTVRARRMRRPPTCCWASRAAEDLSPRAGVPPGRATGMAVLTCRDRAIRVWSLGQGRVAPATATPEPITPSAHIGPPTRSRPRGPRPSRRRTPPRAACQDDPSRAMIRPLTKLW